MRGSSRGASSKAISSVTSASSAGVGAAARSAASQRAAIVPARRGGSARPGRPARRRASGAGCGRRRPRSTLHRLVAVPAHLDDGAPRSPAQAMAVSRPAARGAGVEDDVGVARRLRRAAQSARRAPATTGRRLSIDVDGRHLGARQPRGERSDSSPTTPAPTTTMRSPAPAPLSHSALRAVSMLAASVARRAGTPSGTAHQRGRPATLKQSWCGCRQKTVPAHQLRRALLDNSRRAIAVFHRERETRPPASAQRMRSHSLPAHGPLNTSRSVPRLMPLNSVRTQRLARRRRRQARQRAAPPTPFLAYQSARATRVLPVDRRVIILPPRRVGPLALDEDSHERQLSTPRRRGRLPPARLSLTTPTGLQSIDALTRRRAHRLRPERRHLRGPAAGVAARSWAPAAGPGSTSILFVCFAARHALDGARLLERADRPVAPALPRRTPWPRSRPTPPAGDEHDAARASRPPSS